MQARQSGNASVASDTLRRGQKSRGTDLTNRVAAGCSPRRALRRLRPPEGFSILPKIPCLAHLDSGMKARYKALSRPMRHLQGMHLEHAIRHGKTVEQFLGGFDHEGEPAIRYLSIRFHGGEFSLHLHELFDQGTEDYIDLYSFDYLDLPEDRFEPHPIKFNSMEDALRYAHSEFGAVPERWVNQGVVQDEYADFKRNRPRA
jgi:hypothetical protein